MPERQPAPDVGAPSSGKAEPSRRPTTRKAGKEDREENQPGEALRFFFSCRAVTVVSKVGSAVARDPSHLQGFGDIKSKGNTHINPAHEKHSATGRPTAGFWSARASCRQGSYSLKVYRASRRMRKNWERRMKRAASIRIRPAARMPISEHRCDGARSGPTWRRFRPGTRWRPGEECL